MPGPPGHPHGPHVDRRRRRLQRRQDRHRGLAQCDDHRRASQAAAPGAPTPCRATSPPPRPPRRPTSTLRPTPRAHRTSTCPGPTSRAVAFPSARFRVATRPTPSTSPLGRSRQSVARRHLGRSALAPRRGCFRRHGRQLDRDVAGPTAWVEHLRGADHRRERWGRLRQRCHDCRVSRGRGRGLAHHGRGSDPGHHRRRRCAERAADPQQPSPPLGHRVRLVHDDPVHHARAVRPPQGRNRRRHAGERLRRAGCQAAPPT